MQHDTKTWLLTILAGTIDQSHDCSQGKKKKKKNTPVECEEPGTILNNYNDLNTSHWVGQPQLIQRIMKAL